MKGRLLTFGLELAFLVGVVLYGAARGPDRMPLHWGIDGEPDRVGSRARWLVEISVLTAGLLLLVGLLVLLVRRGPLRLMRLPNKTYWTKPENVPHARDLMLDDVVDVFGDVVLLLAVLELVTVLRARDGQLELPTGLFLGILALFLVSIGWRVARMRGRYAVPGR